MNRAASARMIPPGMKTDLSVVLVQSVMDFHIILSRGEDAVSGLAGSQMEQFHWWNGTTIRTAANACFTWAGGMRMDSSSFFIRGLQCAYS